MTEEEKRDFIQWGRFKVLSKEHLEDYARQALEQLKLISAFQALDRAGQRELRAQVNDAFAEDYESRAIECRRLAKLWRSDAPVEGE